MRGYWDLDRATSHCVSFVDAEDLEDDQDELVEFAANLWQRGFRIGYVDCAKFCAHPWEILSEIGVQLKAAHPPYHESGRLSLVRWLDDLGSLAYSTNGAVIVLDNADQLFATNRRFMTDLIEAFLVQVHHWFQQNLPCHLCLQMSPHPMVAKLFASDSRG